jgi:hypothetical protein
VTIGGSLVWSRLLIFLHKLVKNLQNNQGEPQFLRWGSQSRLDRKLIGDKASQQ